MSQPSNNPYLWVNSNRTPHNQPESQPHQQFSQMGPGSSRFTGLSVTFGVSGGSIQSRQSRMTFPQEQLDCADLSQVENHSLEGLRASAHAGIIDYGYTCGGSGEALETEVKVKLEEDSQTIMDSVERGHSHDLLIKVEKTDAKDFCYDLEKDLSSYDLATDSKSSLGGLQDEQCGMQPNVFSSSSKDTTQIFVKLESATPSKQYPDDTVTASTPQIPFVAPPTNSEPKKSWPTWSPAPSLEVPQTTGIPIPPLFSVLQPQFVPRAFPTQYNWYKTTVVAGGASRKSKVKKKKNKVTHRMPSCPQTVWGMVNLTQFGNKIGTLCMKKKKTKNLDRFLQLGLSHLLFNQLPRGKPDVGLMNFLHSALRTYVPPEWPLDFFFMMDVGAAIVALPPGGFARDVVQCSHMMRYEGRTLVVRLLKSNLGSWPLMFFQAIMNLIDESAVIDGFKTVFFGSIAEEEVAELQKTFKNTQSVQYFMPLHGKLFIEFSTLEDADQFGFQLSRKNPPFGSKIYRFGLTPAAESLNTFAVDGADAHLFNASVPEGSHPPFWIPISSCPYLFPTARPSFIIPEHKTIKDMADVEVFVSKGDCGTFRTIMLTNLPQGYNAHSAIKRRVQPHFANVTPLFDNYSIVILPLQRRAFVHFDDWESCSSCLQKLLQAPILVGKNTLCLHLVTQSMCPQYSEDTLYRSLMALSNTPVQNPNSLSERLLVASVNENIRNSVSKLLDEVTSVGPFVHFLPLGNRICIEMVNSEDVFQLVDNYKKLPSTQKHELLPINDFESCQDVERRLNLASKLEMKTSEGSGEAGFPPSEQILFTLDGESQQHHLMKTSGVLLTSDESLTKTRAVNEDDDVENFRLADKFEHQMFEEADEADRDGRLETKLSVEQLDSVSHDERREQSGHHCLVKTRDSLRGSTENTGVLQGERVEYEMIDSLDDQTTSVSNLDSTAIMDQPNFPAADAKEESQKLVYDQLYQIEDSVEGDTIHVSCIKTSRRRGKEGERKIVFLAKRKSETSGPAAKRSCPPPTRGAADLELPAFTPNNPLGQDFVRLRSGFSCDLCSMFYLNERVAEEHCSSQTHHDNLKNYYQKLQHIK